MAKNRLKEDPTVNCSCSVCTAWRKDRVGLLAEIKAKDERIKELEANQFPAEPICGECGKPRKCLGILWETHLKPCKR